MLGLVQASTCHQQRIELRMPLRGMPEARMLCSRSITLSGSQNTMRSTSMHSNKLTDPPRRATPLPSYHRNESHLYLPKLILNPTTPTPSIQLNPLSRSSRSYLPNSDLTLSLSQGSSDLLPRQSTKRHAPQTARRGRVFVVEQSRQLARRPQTWDRDVVRA